MIYKVCPYILSQKLCYSEKAVGYTMYIIIQLLPQFLFIYICTTIPTYFFIFNDFILVIIYSTLQNAKNLKVGKLWKYLTLYYDLEQTYYPTCPTSLTFYSTLYINPFHFVIAHVVLYWIFPKLQVFLPNFSMYSVARLIVGRHFVTKCTCSDPCMLPGVTCQPWAQPMPPLKMEIAIARPQLANVEKEDTNSILGAMYFYRV